MVICFGGFIHVVIILSCLLFYNIAFVIHPLFFTKYPNQVVNVDRYDYDSLRKWSKENKLVGKCSAMSYPQYFQSIEEKEETINYFERYWVNREGDREYFPILSNDEIKVISYNCLGPLHGESLKHHYAPVNIRKWTRRRDKLLQELRSMDADVYCLQEISKKALKETFIPGLKHIGLECVGFAPTKMTSLEKGKYGHKHIGCAIFTRPSKLELIASKRVHLRDFGSNFLTNCKSDSFIIDLKTKWNSLVVIETRIKSTNQTILIANTHLYWNPFRPDIKSFQVVAAMDAIKAFCKESGFNTTTSCPPLILCGDFNTFPTLHPHDQQSTEPSSLFIYLEQGKLLSTHPQHPDSYSQTIGGTNPKIGDLNIESNDMLCKNIFSAKEFYQERPLLTTKTDDFEGWIDHIWVNRKVAVDRILSVPLRVIDREDEKKQQAFTPIPNKHFASDHIPIGAIIRISS